MTALPDPQRVQLLRSAAGLTQLDVAQALDVPQGTIARFEAGANQLDPSKIQGLAAALSCEAALLAKPLPGLRTSRPWLRAYADASKRSVDQYMADTTIAAEVVVAIGLRPKPDKPLTFLGAPADASDIEEYAGAIRAVADVPEGEPVPNMTRASERLGCVLLPLESELGRHLGLSTRIDGRPYMRVSRPMESVPGDRQRFTVAHELGHLVLHADSPPPSDAAESRSFERQAHRFASAFLLPGDAFLEDVEREGKGRVTLAVLAALKVRWGVSIKAMVVRLQQLGRIDEDHARSLYKQISARGWNSSEPGHVGHEQAIWLRGALERKFPSADPLADAAVVAGVRRSWLARWTQWEVADETLADVVPLFPRLSGAN